MRLTPPMETKPHARAALRLSNMCLGNITAPRLDCRPLMEPTRLGRLTPSSIWWRPHGWWRPQGWRRPKGWRRPEGWRRPHAGRRPDGWRPVRTQDINTHADNIVPGRAWPNRLKVGPPIPCPKKPERHRKPTAGPSRRRKSLECGAGDRLTDQTRRHRAATRTTSTQTHIEATASPPAPIRNPAGDGNSCFRPALTPDPREPHPSSAPVGAPCWRSGRARG